MGTAESAYLVRGPLAAAREESSDAREGLRKGADEEIDLIQDILLREHAPPIGAEQPEVMRNVHHQVGTMRSAHSKQLPEVRVVRVHRER
jgi:hypothetical protein